MRTSRSPILTSSPPISCNLSLPRRNAAASPSRGRSPARSRRTRCRSRRRRSRRVAAHRARRPVPEPCCCGRRRGWCIRDVSRGCCRPWRAEARVFHELGERLGAGVASRREWRIARSHARATAVHGYAVPGTRTGILSPTKPGCSVDEKWHRYSCRPRTHRRGVIHPPAAPRYGGWYAIPGTWFRVPAYGGGCSGEGITLRHTSLIGHHEPPKYPCTAVAVLS